jgi:hypothetical protein
MSSNAMPPAVMCLLSYREQPKTCRSRPVTAEARQSGSMSAPSPTEWPPPPDSQSVPAGPRGGRTRGGMLRVRSSASTCVSLSSLMKVSAHVWLVWMVMCM